jgi:hypothetical protein
MWPCPWDIKRLPPLLCHKIGPNWLFSALLQKDHAAECQFPAAAKATFRWDLTLLF